MTPADTPPWQPDGRTPETPLIGRVAELQVLLDAWREVEGGETAAVFVIGDSGVGKTRLIQTASASMRQEGAAVLSGVCLDIGDASPLHPLRQALRRFHQGAAAGTPAALAARELLGLLDGTAAGPDVGALLERLAQGLSAMSEDRPLVLVVDDLQWADRTTRQLLLYLLAGLGGIRLLLLCAARAEVLHGRDPLQLMLLELRRLRSVHELRLSPLDRVQTEELAAAIVGDALEPTDAEAMWHRSGGNPFVVEELARYARQGRAGIPERPREIVLARVEALPSHARTVVRALAPGVEPVAHALLAKVVPLTEDQVIEAVRTAVAQRILVAGEDGYRFHHRLIKEVLEPQLLPGERVQLHRRYAEALATVADGDLQHARLARHWRLAGEPARALGAAVAAAQEAELLYGFGEAYEHWSTALDLMAATHAREAAGLDRGELARRAAEAAHLCGEHEPALAILEQLAAADPGSPPCWLRVRRARYLAAVGRSAEAEAEYERALTAQDCTDAERATAAACSADLLRQLGRYADAGQRARQALEMARGVVGAATTVVQASAALGFSQACLNDPVAGLRAVREALETAERLGSPDDVGNAYTHLAELLTGPLNHLEDGVEVARRGAERVQKLGLGRTYGSRLLAHAATGLFRVGRWREAETLIADALRHRPSGADAVELLLARCRIGIGYGDLDAAEQDLETIETLLAGDGGARYRLPLCTLRAGLAMWRVRLPEAREAVRQGLMETEVDDVVLLALVWHGLRAEAEIRATLADVPDEEAVARLQAVAERIAHAPVATGPVRDAITGYQELCQAEVTRLRGRSDAVAWARAVQTWRRHNHPYPCAYALLRLAEALFAERTRNARAADALRDAYRIARQLGAEPLVDEILALAERARVVLTDSDTRPVAADEDVPHPAPRTVDELAVLTKRELQVLAEVANGSTNQEIGRTLFISERTVGVHISHILNKLQVRSRVQATALYHRNQRR